MCNGARCVGKLVHDLSLSDEAEFGIETGGGVRRLRLHDDGEVHRITVEMGVPGFTKASIPMRGPAWETFLGQPFDVGGGITLTASAVSMGNPHLVLFVEDDPIGSTSGTSVRPWNTTSRSPRARMWNSLRCTRTPSKHACGSAARARRWRAAAGACAVVVAVNEGGLVSSRTVVRFPGGALEVERLESGEVLLSGEAERVFEGVVDLDRLRGRVRA